MIEFERLNTCIIIDPILYSMSAWRHFHYNAGKNYRILFFLTLYIRFSSYVVILLFFFMHKNLVFNLIYLMLVIIFARLSVTVLSPVIRQWLWLWNHHNIRRMLGVILQKNFLKQKKMSCIHRPLNFLHLLKWVSHTSTFISFFTAPYPFCSWS